MQYEQGGGGSRYREYRVRPAIASAILQTCRNPCLRALLFYLTYCTTILTSKLFTYLPIPQHTFLLITLQFYYKGQYISTKSILQLMLKHCNTIVSILVSFSIIVVPLHELSSVLYLSQTRVTCLQTSPSCLRTKHSNDRPKFICTISGLLYLFSMLKLFLLDCKKSVCKDMPHALLLFSLPRVILPA